LLAGLAMPLDAVAARLSDAIAAFEAGDAARAREAVEGMLPVLAQLRDVGGEVYRSGHVVWMRTPDKKRFVVGSDEVQVRAALETVDAAVPDVKRAVVAVVGDIVGGQVSPPPSSTSCAASATRARRASLSRIPRSWARTACAAS